MDSRSTGRLTAGLVGAVDLEAQCRRVGVRCGAVRYGESGRRYRDFPFRVLIVLQTAERRNNLAERILQGSTAILTQVWLTTFEEVTTQPLGSIWITPRNYPEVTAGTNFVPDHRRDLSP